MGEVLRQRMLELEKKHPSVGAVRSIGLFGIVRAGAQPQDATSRWRRTTARRTRWRRSAASSASNGLYTFVRWNTFFTNPPLTITEAQLEEGLAIIDQGLEITDRAVKE